MGSNDSASGPGAPQFRHLSHDTVTVGPGDEHASAFRVLERAFLKLTASDAHKAVYGDPHNGATLAQAWNTAFALSGIPFVCVLMPRDVPSDVTGIPHVVHMSAGDVSDALASMFQARRPAAAQIFVHDGVSGHSVTLLDHATDQDAFVFMDPWPGRSRLSAGHNSAGIDATHIDGQRWRVRRDDLARVLHAVFMWPAYWAELQGSAYDIRIERLQASEFWTFFRLRERGRTEDATGRTHVQFGPGAFADQVAMSMDLDAAGNVCTVSLRIARGFVGAGTRGLNPLAIDVAKGFLLAVTPQPDRGAAEIVARDLAEFGTAAGARRVMTRVSPDSASFRVIGAYVDPDRSTTEVGTCCQWSVDTVGGETGQQPQVVFTVMTF
jgi:hypothetical protein